MWSANLGESLLVSWRESGSSDSFKAIIETFFGEMVAKEVCCGSLTEVTAAAAVAEKSELAIF